MKQEKNVVGRSSNIVIKSLVAMVKQLGHPTLLLTVIQTHCMEVI